jgi:hypothetical protein
VFKRIIATLKPGGLLLLQGYTPKQIEHGTGGPKAVENMYTTTLLKEAFISFETFKINAYEVELREGAAHSGMSAVIDFAGVK